MEILWHDNRIVNWLLLLKSLFSLFVNNKDKQLDKLMVSLAASWQYPNSNYSYEVLGLFCYNVGCCWKIKLLLPLLLVVV